MKKSHLVISGLSALAFVSLIGVQMNSAPETSSLHAAATDTYAADNCVMNVPHQVSQNQKFTAQITLTNTGTAPWDPTHGILTAQLPNKNKIWKAQTVPVKTKVLPGQTYTFKFTATAPSTKGVYVFAYQMQAPKLGQFGPLCVMEIGVGVPAPDSVKLNIVGMIQNSTDVLVRNQRNVNILRFEAKSQYNLAINKLSFISEYGSLMNADEYTVWVDTDGDQEVDSIAAHATPNGDALTIGDDEFFMHFLDKNQPMIFEIHADIASNLVDHQLRLQFNTNASDYVGAFIPTQTDAEIPLSGIKTNGTCTSTCQIQVSTAQTTIFNIVEQGDLYVTQSSNIRNRQLLGGTLGDEILRVKLYADYEDIDVTHLQFTSSGSNASSINFLELYKVGQTTPFATATTSGCAGNPIINTNGDGSPVTTFCANTQSQQLVVPEGTDVEILVRPRMKADTSGGVSGQKIALFIGSGMGNANVTVKAEGANSGSPLMMSDGDSLAEGEIFINRASPGANMNIVGNSNVSVLSKITSITNANSDPNGTAIPEGPNRIIAKFQFAAAAHTNSNNGLNAATISDIVFKVTSTNMTMSEGSFYFYNEADSTQTVQCKEYSLNGTPLSGMMSGTFYVACTDLVTSNVYTGIDQGTAMTVVLQSDIMQTQIGGAVSTLQVSLGSFENSGRSTFGIGGANSNLQWIDAEGAITSADPRFVWVEYPTTTVSSTAYVSG